MTSKSIITVFALLTCTFPLFGQIEEGSDEGKKLEKKKMEKADYIPEIHGTIRAKYEYQPEINAGRFEVRNARFSVTGNVHPSIAYKAEIDLSDEGNIKMLDAYTRLFPIKDINFTIGQMRVPFTIDAHRSPHQQYFANRSFIAKQVGNVRDVGATVCYQLKKNFPLIIEAGLFNGSGLTNQKEWHKEMNYSIKAQFFFIKGLNIELSTQTIKPESIRIYMYDVGLSYQYKRFLIEGEYLFKQYENNAFQDVHAMNSFANYELPLPRIFKSMSLLVRYDFMTNHSDGYIDSKTGKLNINDYKRQRVTGGVTFNIDKPFIADIRLNYEKYFYSASGIPKESEQDKIVLEFMTRF
ncbi:porin [Coprobacter sp.]